TRSCHSVARTAEACAVISRSRISQRRIHATVDGGSTWHTYPSCLSIRVCQAGHPTINELLKPPSSIQGLITLVDCLAHLVYWPLIDILQRNQLTICYSKRAWSNLTARNRILNFLRPRNLIRVVPGSRSSNTPQPDVEIVSPAGCRRRLGQTLLIRQ